MVQAAARYEQVIGRFAAWAETIPGIRAAIVIGSRARTERPADEWSDLDLIVLCDDPRRYTDHLDWLGQIGRYWATFLEGTPDGRSIERRVLFEDGIDVDFVFDPVGTVTSVDDLGGFALDLLQRGARVVLDKDGVVTGLLNSLPPREKAAAQLPSEADFLNRVNDFWYHTVWTAKKLRRGELWTAHGCSDNYLKWNLLLPVIEWHARAAHGWDYDTWMRGRFLEQWADPRIVSALEGAWAHHDREDLWRGLFATMDLFRWLARETAERLGYVYPVEVEAQTSAWVERLFSQRDG